MYIPNYFKVDNIEEISSFVQKNSFGTVVTTVQGKPIATHLPMQLIRKGDDYFITGHLSYGNPQWKTFDTSDEVLVMFQGPHAYISSSWYESENVPTWNYQSVHVYGEVSILDKEELKEDLTMLLQKYEKHREEPVLWDRLSHSLLEKQLNGIVGFKIKIREIQAAYKLSQNRNKKDYCNIIDKLNEEEDFSSHRIAEVMSKRNS